MTKVRASFNPFVSRFSSSTAKRYYQVVRSVPSLIFSLLCLILVWPRVEVFSSFSEIAGIASHWFAQQFCYSFAAWSGFGVICLLFWLLTATFPYAVFMRLTHWCVVLRTISWYCTLPGFLLMYIKVTSTTCYMNMQIFLVTLIGGLLLLFLAGVYSFRLYSLCRITSDMEKTLACGTSDQAFGFSFNMTAANIALAAAALFAASFMSDYAFIARIMEAPYAHMLEALNTWMDILTSSFEICVFDYYFTIPWIACCTAAVNIPMIFIYKKYMKATQEPIETKGVSE